MTLRNRTRDRLPHVGVLAATKYLATSLAQELGIARALALSPDGIKRGAGRGTLLSALLVDEGVWPLDQELQDVLLPALGPEKGYILRMQRVDPHRQISLQKRPHP
jgi:hypothetical protein